MLNKLTTRGFSPETKDFQERTAHSKCLLYDCKIGPCHWDPDLMVEEFYWVMILPPM